MEISLKNIEFFHSVVSSRSSFVAIALHSSASNVKNAASFSNTLSMARKEMKRTNKKAYKEERSAIEKERKDKDNAQ